MSPCTTIVLIVVAIVLGFALWGYLDRKYAPLVMAPTIHSEGEPWGSSYFRKYAPMVMAPAPVCPPIRLRDDADYADCITRYAQLRAAAEHAKETAMQPITIKLDADTTAMRFAYAIGYAQHQANQRGMVHHTPYDFHPPLPPIELEGPHCFKARFERKPKEPVEQAMERAWADFKSHLLYHDTLDKMVKERIEADAATKEG